LKFLFPFSRAAQTFCFFVVFFIGKDIFKFGPKLKLRFSILNTKTNNTPIENTTDEQILIKRKNNGPAELRLQRD